MLCERCSLAAQLNANVNGGKLKHHNSHQDMVESAKDSCGICAAVVSGTGKQSRGIVEQEQSGLHDPETCKYFAGLSSVKM
jgi:hypothetical protein